MLQNIIPSKARRKILEIFFHHPNENYYLRRIVREIKEEVNAVKRELDILFKAKVLVKERRLNKILYFINKHYFHYDEFVRIFAKTLPISQAIYDKLPQLGKTKFIAMSTKFAKQTPIKEDEIYLLFVGTVVVPEITAIISEAEKGFEKEINYTVMNEEEFVFRKKNNDPFIWRFLRQPKVMLVGQEEELVK